MAQDINQFLEGFYRENYQKLYVYAFAILKQRMDAEATVQEAFTVACETPIDLIHSKNPTGWMIKTVRYRALQILDERKRTAALLLALETLAPNTDRSAGGCEATELVSLCQSILSKEEFDFFWRIANGATTFREEKERLGIELPACYKRYERIRDKLQQAVSKYYKF